MAGEAHKWLRLPGLTPSLHDEYCAGLPSVCQAASGEIQVLSVHAGWLLAERGLRMLVGFVVTVAVARHLGPADFGALSVTLSVVAILGSIAGVGLDDVVTRDLAARPEEAGRVLVAGGQVRLAAALTSYGMIAVASFAITDGRTACYIAVAAAAVWFSPAELVDGWFQSRRNVGPVVLARQSAIVVCSALRLALVTSGAALATFVAVIPLEAAFAGALLAWTFARDPSRPKLVRPEPALRSGLVSRGLPLMASGLLVLLTLQSDRLLLAHFSGETAAGVYAAAARLTEMFHVVPVAVGAALLPAWVQLRTSNTQAYWRRAGRGLLVFFGLGAIVASVLSWSAAWGVPLLYRGDYAGAAAVLSIHVWTLPFVWVVSLRSRLLVIEGCTRCLWGMSLLTAACNMGVNLWLVPRHGALGAAWGALSAWAFSALVAPFFFRDARAVWQRMGSAQREPVA